MNTSEYFSEISKIYRSGRATEHSYRGALALLVENLVHGIKATNEPKRIKCGAPDYIITQKDIPIGYIEAKDLDIKINLDEIEKSEQLERYFKSLDNLILTDYIEFRFYKSGIKVASVSIGALDGGKLTPANEEWPKFENLIKNFCSYVGQTITSSEKLAKMMADKARLMEEVIYKTVMGEEDNSLKDQLRAFQSILIHDMDAKQFADIYAQTIAYGMFAARLHDKTLDTFSRQEALLLVPKSNPFLRQLFSYIAGADLDDNVVWVVDDLANVFLHTDIHKLLEDFGSATKQTDPMIHFYETFLGEYDPKLKKSRGVYYTPEPVVNFIVRAVDDILKTEFRIADGLADTSKVEIETEEQGTYQSKKAKDREVRKVKKLVHRVQILDPATGTGTFLADVIKHIYKKYEGQAGLWSSYVEEHLIPRLHGFEILMAAYTMCHTKLELLLSGTGYKAKSDKRLNVYLTNALEEAHPDTGSLFASWLSKEASEANEVKRDCPVMVVMGNPPYSISSSNKGEWIEGLVADYKKDLNERNIQSLSDDYIKFIRYGQYFIEKNEEGVLAYISNNSFIDGVIHRQMRKHLLESFDKIYILDLHGNAKKKEVCSDGTQDQNVFDIMQGVSINIFIKKGKKPPKELGKVFHCSLFGKRDMKYKFLFESSLKTINYKELPNDAPNYYFVEKNFSEAKDYVRGFSITELLSFKTSGIKTHDDIHMVSYNVAQLEKNIIALSHHFESSKVYTYSYRPFDNGYIYYDTKLLGRAREKTIYHLKYENLGLILVAQPQAANLQFFDCIFLTKCLTDTNMFRRGGPVSFPLYLYPETNGQQTLSENITRTPNMNQDIVKQIEEILGLIFTNEKSQNSGTFAPIDILDYIYAILHNPSYRKKYKEFIQIDFPRIPYPENKKSFWKLVKLGSELRKIHLLESPVISKYITQYPMDGDNKVTKISYDDKTGKVWINLKQYFDKVPKIAWEFYIGGYQPAQKWLKDRKGRELKHDDILHYQKIIVALTETDKIMKEIDKVFLSF